MIKVIQISPRTGSNALKGGLVMVLGSILDGLPIIVIYIIRGLPQTLQRKLFQLAHKCTFQISYAVLLHNVSCIPLATRHKHGIQWALK